MNKQPSKQKIKTEFEFIFDAAAVKKLLTRSLNATKTCSPDLEHLDSDYKKALWEDERQTPGLILEIGEGVCLTSNDWDLSDAQRQAEKVFALGVPEPEFSSVGVWSNRDQFREELFGSWTDYPPLFADVIPASLVETYFSNYPGAERILIDVDCKVRRGVGEEHWRPISVRHPDMQP